MSRYLLTHRSAAVELSSPEGTSAGLRESEASFRATFENAAVGIAHVAADGSWLRVNRRLCEIIGYAKDELLAISFQDITHPDDLEADLAQLRRMHDSGIDTYNREKRYLRKDGSAVWIRLTASAVRKGDGTIDYFISVLEDISEQKRAEIALRASEEKFRGIFEHAATGIAITDLQGRFQSCNRAYYNMLGYTADELRTLDYPRLIHPEDREANMVQISRIHARQAPSFDIVNRFLTKDGKPLWVHKHVSLLQDAAGEPTGMIALVTDMTERKRYEERLRESEERLRLALGAAQLGTWRWDGTEGPDAVQADARCKVLFGLSPGANVSFGTWADTFPPEDKGAAKAAVARAFDPADPHDDYDCEHRVKHPDGRVSWLSLKGRAFFEANRTAPWGRRAKFIAGVVRDVTQAHRAEEIRRERERRNRYLLELEKRLQDAATAGEAVSAACQAFGEELGATLALVGEFQPDSEDIVVKGAWRAHGDLAPLGRRRVADLCGKHTAALLAGEAVLVRNVGLEAPSNAGEAVQAAFAALGLRSLIGVPLMRDGTPRGFLFVADASPRDWTEAEAELAHGTINRAWQALEKAEADALRESEARLRHLGDSLPDSAVFRYALEADGAPRFLYISAGIEQLNGVRVEDVLGDAGVLHRQILPDYLPKLAEARRRSARDLSDFKMELPMRRPDGEVRWMQWQSRPRRREDGRVIWDGVQTDITERRQAEEALRESEERLRLSNEAAGIGTFTVDLERNCAFYSPEAAAIYGFPGIQAAAVTTAFSRVHRDDVAWVRKQYEGAASGANTGQLKMDFRFVRPGGEVRWMTWIGRADFREDQSGRRPFRILGACLDITEQREISRRIQHAIAVDKINAELVLAHRLAQEASQAKSAFLANMSHELRTPLNAILGFSEIIRDKLFGKDLDVYAGFAGDIHRSGAHLLNIVNDVLDVSKIEAGKFELLEEKVKVHAAIQESLLAVEQQAACGGICLTESVPDIGASFFGDQTKLKQIIINLLSNAIKFTPQGGSAAITAAADEDGGMSLMIHDTGIGMSGEEIQVSLELFRQVDNSHSRRFEGTGLGLPLAVRLTELHGGTLTIESIPGKGTTVTVRFPANRIIWDQNGEASKAETTAPFKIASRS
jgi:PAS domain S-box-containing protein